MTEPEMAIQWRAGVPVAQIAAAAGVTANVVIGRAHRRGWGDHPQFAARIGRPAPTMWDRMLALHDRMDAVLRETAGALGREGQRR